MQQCENWLVAACDRSQTPSATNDADLRQNGTDLSARFFFPEPSQTTPG